MIAYSSTVAFSTVSYGALFGEVLKISKLETEVYVTGLTIGHSLSLCSLRRIAKTVARHPNGQNTFLKQVRGVG